MVCTSSARPALHSSAMTTALVAIFRAEFDLDQFVIDQRALQFGDNAFVQAVASDDQDRLQVMTNGLVLLLLLVIERHNLTLSV